MGVQSSGVPFVLRCADVESTSGPLRGGLLGYGVCVCAFVCVCVCRSIESEAGAGGRQRRQRGRPQRNLKRDQGARSTCARRSVSQSSDGTSIGCDVGTPAPSAARRSAMRRRR